MKLAGEKIRYRPNWLFSKLDNPRFKLEDTYKEEILNGLLVPDGVDDVVSFNDYPYFEGNSIIEFYYYIPLPDSLEVPGFPLTLPTTFVLPGFGNFTGEGPIMAFSRGGEDILYININNNQLEVHADSIQATNNYAVDITNYYGQIIKVYVKKSFREVLEVKINNALLPNIGILENPPTQPNKSIFKVDLTTVNTTYGNIGLIWDLNFYDFEGNLRNRYKGYPNGDTDEAWRDLIVQNNGSVSGNPDTIDLQWSTVRAWGLLERFLDTLCIEMDEQVIPYLENTGYIYDANELSRIPRTDYYQLLIPLAEMFTNPPDIFDTNGQYAQLLRYIIHILFRRGTKKAIELYFRIAGYTVNISDSIPQVSKYDSGLFYDIDFVYDDVVGYTNDLIIELSDVDPSNPNPPSAEKITLFEQAITKFLLPINATLTSVSYIS